MNAKGYYEELTETEEKPIIFNAQLQAIIDAPLPAFRANIRDLTRKEWAQHIRKLFKDMKLTGISVTTPNYSMASSISIELPRDRFTPEHEAEHNAIDERERNTGSWMGYGHYCPICKHRWQAHKKIETIILAAFPDLDDRSDTQTDYFDYCLSIN